MKESKILLNEIREEELNEINGGSRGLSTIWGAIAGAIWGSCAWPEGFYSSGNGTSGGSMCTSR